MALEGFSVHAHTRMSGRDRDALERPCRYVGRPRVATERLYPEPGGRVTCKLGKPWSDATHALDFAPRIFLERLAALVPPPRADLVTDHGVFAPSPTLRRAVVSQTASPPSALPVRCRRPRGGHPGEAVPASRDRCSWAELLARVFLVDVLACPGGGRREIIAMTTDPPVIRAILGCLYLSARQVVTDPPHAPP